MPCIAYVQAGLLVCGRRQPISWKDIHPYPDTGAADSVNERNIRLSNSAN